jgi:glycosyltransferase involved in cell wall biosynthesis
MSRQASRRVLMLLENNPYPDDVRVRLEALSLTREGYDVTVVAPRGPGEARREVVEGVYVERFRLPEPGDSAAAILLEYAVANIQLHLRGLRALRGSDVLHLHNPPDTLFAVGWVARRLGKRVVFDHHDIAPELFAEKFGTGRMVRILKLLEGLSYRVAHVALTVNGSIAAIAGMRGGLRPGDVFVVRNAPPRHMLTEARPGREGPLREPRLIFVGSMESQDGVDSLPRLLTLLRERHGLAPRLTLVGDGGRRAELERAMVAAGHAGSVTFTGRIPHDRIPAVLAEADVCVEPAGCSPLNHRCSMVKVYEYMAAARPIVGFPLDEVRRLGGEDILFAECDDMDDMAAQIARLAEDGALRRTLGERLHARAADLTWERSEEALLEAYRRVLGEPAAAVPAQVPAPG